MLGFAYAASWWADQRFYSAFGIAPQDIGLTPSGGLSDIVGAIVRLGLWVAIALIVLGLLPVIAVSAAGFSIEAPKQGRGRRIAATVLAVAAGIVAFLAYGWLAGWIYAGAAGFVLLLAVFVWWTFSETRAGWALKVLDAFIVVAVVGLLLVDLPDDAAGAAACVVDNPSLAVKGINAPIGFVHLMLLDVYAQPATITWIGSQPPVGIDQNPFSGVYLGTSNGTAVVYRPGSPARLVRFPAGDVTVTLNPRGKTCKQAH